MRAKMQRTILGALALLLIVAAGAVRLYQGGGGDAEFLIGMLLRCGLVLGALWLAYPHLDVLPRVLLGALVVIVLVIAVLARSKGLIVIGVGIAVVLLVLRALKRKAPAAENRPPR